ncbi:protein TIFY 6B-like [Andrographis paniculata]|uniref:protein TIFY 6B-like n=1 Tax=Andrographis paniculata TaxID=175694 RepID=UPI0021E7BE6D|nr:protein TIFY 6B-like [Andrographis paniculata]XP_051144432.1 protein TIFY 6B-like [Andrographis paniculata]
MERDFLGLHSKESAAVKEEFVDGSCEDFEYKRSSGGPTGFPHFVSLKSEQDKKPSKINSDLASHGYKNFGGTSMKQQSLVGNQVSTPHLPSAAMVGATELWTNSMASTVSTQLTIFYGGVVHVFDGITPEKAEAIVLLAGAGCIPSSVAHQKLHLQATASKLPTVDQALANQNMTPGCDLPSPISVTSHPSDQSGIPAVNNNDVKGSQTTGMPANLGAKVELSKVMSPMGSMGASAIISSAVPLARKASLARFLEKRKERVMNASPYSLSKKNTDCATPESNGIGFSATSGASSSSISISKEISGDA